MPFSNGWVLPIRICRRALAHCAAALVAGLLAPVALAQSDPVARVDGYREILGLTLGKSTKADVAKLFGGADTATGVRCVRGAGLSAGGKLTEDTVEVRFEYDVAETVRAIDLRNSSVERCARDPNMKIHDEAMLRTKAQFFGGARVGMLLTDLLLTSGRPWAVNNTEWIFEQSGERRAGAPNGEAQPVFDYVLIIKANVRESTVNALYVSYAEHKR